jgi:hypothetical protein
MYVLYTLALRCLGLLIFVGSAIAFALSCLGLLVLLVAARVLDVTWKYPRVILWFTAIGAMALICLNEGIGTGLLVIGVVAAVVSVPSLVASRLRHASRGARKPLSSLRQGS